MADSIERSSASSPPASSAGSDVEKQRAPAVAAGEAHSAPSLDELLYPHDSYTRDNVYWADLPFAQKARWVSAQSNAEARRELAVIGRMFRQAPLSPFKAYFSNYVVTGLGLFSEAWVLFSVGNLMPLMKAVWPQCFSKHTVCAKEWVSAVEWLEIVGIICGQVVVGIEGDFIGRRFGMVQDALVLCFGGILLTAMWAGTLQGFVIFWAFALFVFGFGTGGEYPMTSTSAMETSSTVEGATTEDRMHRGRRVSLAFTMQGWGQFVQQAVLLILLLAFNSGTLQPPFSEPTAQATFRVSFALMVPLTAWLAWHRFNKRYPGDEQLKAAKKRLNTSGYDIKSLKLAGSHYYGRLIGTGVVWFVNDVLFYGSKIFSGVFISLITGGNSSLRTTWTYNLISVGTGLVGYYIGSLLIDHKLYGRKWMQANGLMVLFILFFLCAVLYPELTKPGNGVRWFQAIYFLSGFFTQFGPNITSYLLAAEVYPASIRATCHGSSAAMGKLGALLPAVLYSYIPNRTKFWFVCWFGLLGWALTLIFVPDTTGLDLAEQERYWEYVSQGREEEYHGVAVHPRHLSLWERLVHRRHLAYDPELDRAARLELLQHVVEDENGRLKPAGSTVAAAAQAAGKLEPPQPVATHHASKLADLESKLG